MLKCSSGRPVNIKASSCMLPQLAAAEHRLLSYAAWDIKGKAAASEDFFFFPPQFHTITPRVLPSATAQALSPKRGFPVLVVGRSSCCLIPTFTAPPLPASFPSRCRVQSFPTHISRLPRLSPSSSKHPKKISHFLLPHRWHFLVTVRPLDLSNTSSSI